MSIRLNAAVGLLTAACAGLLPAVTTAQTKLLRFPDIHGDRVVFCYAGDIWTAPATGGTATRLTAHPGLELFPKFSPDGKWIAFTGQYDGDEQVYVIPAAGGEPRQLTFYPARGPLAPRWGYDNQVYGWTPDGDAVLFRSLRDADGSAPRAASTRCALDGRPRRGRCRCRPPGAGDFSPDGKRIVYSPLFRDFRTWKRYEGGWAQDLYIFDLATNEAKPIADDRAHRARPDVDRRHHLLRLRPRRHAQPLRVRRSTTEAVTQLTTSSTWDVRWPSVRQRRDGSSTSSTASCTSSTSQAKADQPLAIAVPDDGVAMRPARVSGGEADRGLRALARRASGRSFVARGDVFTAADREGRRRAT